jgi:carboxyl-terminal processing protease
LRKAVSFLVYLLAAGLIVGAVYVAGVGTGWYVASASPPPATVAPQATPRATFSPTPRAAPAPTAQIPSSVPASFKVLWEAWDLINRDFYGRQSLDPQKLVYGAIQGMVNALGDPHSYFLTPSDSVLASQDLSGSFEGIGATVEKRDNKLLVVSPIEDSPAAKAGLKPGDNITQVDGKPTGPLSLTEGVALIRGKAGTQVTLTVVREGQTAPLTFQIVRATISMSTVRTKDLDGGLVYVRLTSFSEPTTQQLNDALKTLMAKKPTGLVLDLRSNPGGYLSTSVDVASQFMKSGLVVYEENADGKRDEFSVRRGGLATDLPMAVLVNAGSASASEIVAGALQDAKRAVLIGDKTFGKGSVQVTQTLSDGSGVHLTIAHWFTPAGRQIQDVGLTPDYVVPLTDDDVTNNRDPQLERAVQYLQTGR